MERDEERKYAVSIYAKNNDYANLLWTIRRAQIVVDCETFLKVLGALRMQAVLQSRIRRVSIKMADSKKDWAVLCSVYLIIEGRRAIANFARTLDNATMESSTVECVLYEDLRDRVLSLVGGSLIKLF